MQLVITTYHYCQAPLGSNVSKLVVHSCFSFLSLAKSFGTTLKTWRHCNDWFSSQLRKIVEFWSPCSHCRFLSIQGLSILSCANYSLLVFFSSLAMSLHCSKCYSLQSFQLFQPLLLFLSSPIVHICL